MPALAFVRSNPIGNDTGTNAPDALVSQYLSAMATHGRGQGELSRRRRRPDATIRAIAAATGKDGKLAGLKRIKVGEQGDVVDLHQAWRNHMQHHGAGIRANATAGLHLLVGVSPSWIAETGDVHAPGNPRNKELYLAAWRWAEQALGGVFALRMDFDEHGSGVVDVFAAPIREQGRKASRRKFVGCSQAKDELKRRHGARTSYGAMQDSWAEYCQRHLSPDIERGEGKADTGREHLTPEQFGEAMDGLTEQARANLARQLAALRKRKRQHDRREKHIRLADKAIREAAEIVRSRQDAAALVDDAEALAADAAAAIDGDGHAIGRLDERYREGGAHSKGRAHTRDNER